MADTAPPLGIYTEEGEKGRERRKERKRQRGGEGDRFWFWFCEECCLIQECGLVPLSLTLYNIHSFLDSVLYVVKYNFLCTHTGIHTLGPSIHVKGKAK